MYAYPCSTLTPLYGHSKAQISKGRNMNSCGTIARIPHFSRRFSGSLRSECRYQCSGNFWAPVRILFRTADCPASPLYPQCYLPTSSRPATIFQERGQLCPPGVCWHSKTRGHGCPRSFGYGSAALCFLCHFVATGFPEVFQGVLWR